jgi:hypothetical protein
LFPSNCNGAALWARACSMTGTNDSPHTGQTARTNDEQDKDEHDDGNDAL